MKNLSLFILSILNLLNMALGQAPPEAFNYSGAARDAGGNPISEKTIGIEISILKSSPTGDVQYRERHFVNTDKFGVFNCTVGQGSVQQGNFRAIDWSNDSYYLRVSLDASGGTNFVVLGTTQLLSVPYALYAKNSQPTYVKAGENVTISGNGSQNNPYIISFFKDTGKVTSLNCNNSTVSGNLTLGIKAEGVSVAIPYTGGNGGNFNEMIFTSTIVSGLTVVLSPGNLAIGDGILNFNVTGTPTKSGTISYNIHFGGISCLLNLTINTQVLNSQHSCGSNNVHNDSLVYGSIADQSGNIYRTIIIGNQEWMAENLKTTIYRSGDSITKVIDNSTWSSTSSGAYCFYNNDSANICPYGYLYNWYAVQENRNLCPLGWHVPSVSEWDILSEYLGDISVAGGKMKTKGTSYWNNPNTLATNSSGFSGLPGGNRSFNGNYSNILSNGSWWASDLSDFRRLINNSGVFFKSEGVDKHTGVSVRCIRD